MQATFSKWTALTLAALLLIAAGYAGFSGIAQSQWWCERHEHYSSLESRAATELDSVTYELSRYSACEETGRPGAQVRASVPSWENRQVANQHFRQRGWEPVDGRLKSPDGKVLVQTITSRDPAAEKTSVEVAFIPVDG